MTARIRKTRMPQFSAIYAAPENGRGEPRPGWYASHYGVPVGPPLATEAEALRTLAEYRRDLDRDLGSI